MLWPILLLEFLWRSYKNWTATPKPNSYTPSPSNKPSTAACSCCASPPGSDMQPGSLVTYKADALMYGVMLYVGLTKDGLLECESLHERNPDGSFRRDVFQALELEEFDRVREAA